MKELFSLGKLNISDFLSIDNNTEQKKYELKLILDENGAVRLNECAPLDSMYGKYWYRSGINQTMRAELKSIVDSIVKVSNFSPNDVWIDIACNDGTMFEFIPDDIIKIGIDPADDSYFNESKKKANLVIQDFFTEESYSKCKFGHIKAKIITVIAMFYDLDKPDIFLQDINKVLDDDGLLIMQMSYTPLMIEQLAFDNICHEHTYYYSLFNIKKLLEKNGFSVVDCQLNDVNGGSFRLYIKKSGKEKSFYTQPYRDVCNFRINSLLNYESTLNLDSVNTWIDFYNRINELKDITLDFVKKAKEEGKSVWGYGASTKGSTLLQYFGLDNTLIDGISDRNPYKWGLKTSGWITILCEWCSKKDEYKNRPWELLPESKFDDASKEVRKIKLDKLSEGI